MHTTHRLFTAAALTLFAGSASTLANPTNWYTNAGPINSRGLVGSANNTVVNLPLPALPAGNGSNYWSHITISGNLNEVDTSTFAAEACIEVTLPGGGKFVIKPFNVGGFTGTIPIPPGAAIASPSPLPGAGMATLRFFELYEDSTICADSTWTNLSIKLHDNLGNDPYPYAVDIPVTPANPDDHTNGNWFTKGQPVNGQITTFTVERVVDSFRFKGYGTAMCGWNTSNSSSPLNIARYTFTADRADGAGTVSWTVTPFGELAASTTAFDIFMDTPVPVLTGPTHPWSYTLAEGNNPVAPVGNGIRMAAIWFAVQPIGPNAPSATDLGVIRGKPAPGPAETTVVKSETFSTLAHETHWYTFTTEAACSDATGYWLDIHTQIPAGSPIADQELGLYTTSGHRVANDDDGGSEARSMLTFGDSSPIRPPVTATGGPQARNGHNGVLPAGLHYLAVPQFNAEFADTGWFINVEGALAGQMGFEFRTNLPAGPCGPADVGSAGGVAGADGILDNNDFIAFITNFFAQAPSADVGIAGGLAGSDNAWDNNDFIAFISLFFAGCP